MSDSRIVAVKRVGSQTRRGNRRWRLPACTAILAISQVLAGNSPTNQPPAFKQLRYDESYVYLRDASRRSDYLDAIKFIPVGTNRNSYLTLGGETRQRYEYFHNNLWGRAPQDDNGYLLQRYMIHADAHFGDSFRVFTQFKSGLEDGRKRGPRLTDRDDFDLNSSTCAPRGHKRIL